ncbi:MAG: general secretion pathway protein GspB [Candidatus Omnitrophota bacterium]|nr:general secretion pathway protein GspB [Candidatus Omnitrophota bacterium]
MFFAKNKNRDRDHFYILSLFFKKWSLSLFLLVCQLTAIISNCAFAEEGFKYDAKSRRDPFIPLISETGGYASDAYEASAIEDIRLEGIVWDDVNGSIAIINGEIAKEGDSLGSVKILKINKDSVIFDVNGESLKIELNKE